MKNFRDAKVGIGQSLGSVSVLEQSFRGTRLPRRQSEKSKETRRIIIRTAIYCIMKFGYFRTSLPLVSETGGISRGAIYYHFHQPQDLIVATITQIYESATETISSYMSGYTPADGRCHQFLIKCCGGTGTDELRLAMELRAISRTDDYLYELLIPLERMMVSKITNEILSSSANKSVPLENAMIYVNLMICMLELFCNNRDDELSSESLHLLSSALDASCTQNILRFQQAAVGAQHLQPTSQRPLPKMVLGA